MHAKLHRCAIILLGLGCATAQAEDLTETLTSAQLASPAVHTDRTIAQMFHEPGPRLASATTSGTDTGRSLHFEREARWLRRIEALGDDGIPMFRFRETLNMNLAFGINPDGFIGIYTVGSRH
ncbi:MAG: hypothetical protein R3E77_11900 [Steroidobacteraceae bacterium]